MTKDKTHEELLLELEKIKGQLEEAEETLRAIRSGEVDALVVSGKKGDQVFTLKGAEQPYRILIEEMSEGAVMLAADDSILYCNSGFAGMLKTPLEKLMGTALEHYIAPSNETVFTELMRQGREGNSSGEITLLAGDGTFVPVQLSFNTLEMDGAKLAYLVAADLTGQKRIQDELRRARDELEIRVDERTAELAKTNSALHYEITERKRGEKELNKNRKQLQSILDNTPSIVFIKDMDGRYILFNRQWEKLFNPKGTKLHDKTDYEIFPPELAEKLHANDLLVIDSRTSIDFEESVHLSDGTLHTYLSTKSPIFEDSGKIFAICGISTDITGRKRAEEVLQKAHDELELRVNDRTAQLKESLDEKEILLREIHHRVKNNMQVISGLLMLQEEFSNDKKVSEIIRESQNRIDSMALIHEKLYRSESLSKIDFKEYVDELVSGLFESYGIIESKVRLRVNAENIFVGIDLAIPCGLIINELVSNSLKHAFPGNNNGEIEISMISTGEDMIELKVRDNGVGIPVGIDFRKNESLGLHIVNILVENQLHGEITMNRNKGTEFMIRFRGMK